MSQLSIRRQIAIYVEDQTLAEMWAAVRGIGALRSISVDITRHCNLRCVGCYFFAEDMDLVGEASDAEFEKFIHGELQRGTNFVTVIGGEPSLAIERVRALARAFRVTVVTNGLRPLPVEGLESISIGISVWGDRATDRNLRGAGKLNIFDRALAAYRGDARVVWYLTLPPNPSEDTADIVDACVDAGHLVGFNYYGDLSKLGGKFDHLHGFAGAGRFVEAMIDRHPAHVIFTSYVNQVITTGTMHGLKWGYDVCASVSADNDKNAARLANGQPYSPHFRAYNPDLQTTRRCCVGENRDCATCFDVWAHLSWIALNFERHLGSAEEFENWLTTVYLFYGAAGLFESSRFRAMVPRLHDRRRRAEAHVT